MNTADAHKVSEWAMKAAATAQAARYDFKTLPIGTRRWREAHLSALRHERIARTYADALISFGASELRRQSEE